jgi:4-hydroxy-tetrahydrodipicolinate synthase
MNRPFGAVVTAMATPMHPDGSIDLDATAALARYLADHGSDGIVVSGTTGEAPTTHSPEKVAIIEAARAAVGADAKIYAGAGSNDTAHAVRMAEQAAAAGADGLLSVTPYYSKPSQAGIVAHFTAIATATDLPVMVYDIPGRTGMRLAPETIDELAQRENIVAVKDATGDVNAARYAMERTGMAWYSGDDPLNLDFLRAGAAGMVSVASHVAGDSYAAMVAAHDAGDDAAAQAIADGVAPLVEAIMGKGLGAPYAKAAMQALGVIPDRTMRLPHLALSPREYDELREALEKAGLL